MGPSAGVARVSGLELATDGADSASAATKTRLDSCPSISNLVCKGYVEYILVGVF